MSTFEYLAVLVSIVVGLAVAHVLQAVGRIISHPGRQKLFWVHSIWVLYALMQVFFFWWFELGYRVVVEWTPVLYVFVVSYAVALYIECVVLVPDDALPDYRTYYFARQRWILGVIVVVWVIDLLDTLLKPSRMEFARQSPLVFAGQYLVTWTLLATAMITKKVWYHGLVAILMLLAMAAALLLGPPVRG